MTIKQQGGIFGRNPTFNNAEVSNDLTVGGNAVVDIDLTVSGSALVDNVKVIEDLELRMSKTAFGSGVAYGYIFKTGSGGSAPFNQAGALIYQPRTSTTDGRSNHKFYTGDPLTLALDLKPDQNAHFGGNVVLNSGAGIDFSATAGTGTSELFDDYEEGTWTPVSSAGGTLLTTLSTYTKVGRLVTINSYISLTASPYPAASFTISGLPFTSISQSRPSVTCVVLDADNSYVAANGIATIGGTSSSIAIVSPITPAGDDRFILSACYYTS